MTQSDFDSFTELLKDEAQFYPQAATTTGARAAGYFESLGRFALDDIRVALLALRERNEFFPTIRAIVETLEGAAIDRAQLAWGALLEAAASGGYASVKFFDQATAAAMDIQFGGWLKMCEVLNAGWISDSGEHKGGCSDEMLAHHKNGFLKAYVSASKSSARVDTYRPGRTELSMRNGDEWQARMGGTMIQPVLLVGAQAAREIKLPFDVQKGALTEAAQRAIESGPRALLGFAEQFKPRVALSEGAQRALPAADEMVSDEERRAIIADLKSRHGTSPYLKLLPGANDEQAAA